MGLNFGLGFWEYVSSSSGGTVTVGRTASNIGGNLTSITVGFTGSAPSSGTWIVLVVNENTTACTVSNGSGTAWTTLYSNNGTGNHIYYKKCNGAEPTSYTVTYNGASKGDACAVAMMEITGANATNPESTATATTTSTSPTITVSGSDLIVLVEEHIGGSTTNTPPSGYTTQVATGSLLSTSLFVNIATKSGVTGTISPGNWANTASIIAILGFKP